MGTRLQLHGLKEWCSKEGTHVMYAHVPNLNSSLIPKKSKRGLVAFPCLICRCCTRHQTRATVGHASFQTSDQLTITVTKTNVEPERVTVSHYIG